MHKRTTLFLFAALLVIAACTNKKKSASEPVTAHQAQDHWSYQGETSPEHWTEIEKNSDCGGASQSPINIIDNTTVPMNPNDSLHLFYSPKTVLSKVENNGHSIQFDFETGDSIQFKNQVYYLKQIHFHEPSEHKINGVTYPIEAHLVHMSQNKQLMVFSVLGVEGEESQMFEFFKSFLPLENGETKEIHQELDITNLSLENRGYYYYSGSLTTPPCTENVNWIVFKDPIVISLDEVLALRKNMPLNNYRNEQPINDRTIYHK